MRASEGDLLEQLEKLLAKEKSLEHELQQLKTKMAQAQAGDLESQARDIKGVKVLAARVDGFDRAAAAHAGGFAAQQMEDRGGGAGEPPRIRMSRSSAASRRI